MKVFAELEIVEQTVEQSLIDNRDVLSLALLSIIDSCRRNPTKFNISYYNWLSAATTTSTTEIRLTEFGSSKFGIVVTQGKDKAVEVIYAESFSQPTY